LKTTPTEPYNLRSLPPHAGHSVNDASLNDWTASNRCSHAVHAY